VTEYDADAFACHMCSYIHGHGKMEEAVHELPLPKLLSFDRFSTHSAFMTLNQASTNDCVH